MMRRNTRRRYQNSVRDGRWAEVVLGSPDKYPSPLMRSLALGVVHRNGKAHEREGCPLCLPCAREISA
jgi:hypothetical protein